MAYSGKILNAKPKTNLKQNFENIKRVIKGATKDPFDISGIYGKPSRGIKKIATD